MGGNNNISRDELTFQLIILEKTVSRYIPRPTVFSRFILLQ